MAQKLRNHIIEYAIPRSRIQEALDHATKTGSTEKFGTLELEAKSLFTDLSTTGEAGEILLYLLTDVYLGYPQILCKMPLKTSSKMHYHGVDGVHGTVDEKSGTLALYWGESKLHKTVSAAISECFESIAPFLKAEGGSKAPHGRDLQLLRDNLDLNDESLEKALQKYLDPDDPQYLQLEYRGVCLAGFDLEGYPNPFESDARAKLTAEMTTSLKRWHSLIHQAVQKHKIELVKIEMLCIPFPSVDEFREAFLMEMGLLHAN